MPCSDEYSNGSRVVYETDPEIKRRLDNVTQLLCATCKTLTKNGGRLEHLGVPGLVQWWEQHQYEDRQREAREKQMRERERNRKMANLKRLAQELGIKIQT